MVPLLCCHLAFCLSFFPFVVFPFPSIQTFSETAYSGQGRWQGPEPIPEAMGARWGTTQDGALTHRSLPFPLFLNDSVYIMQECIKTHQRKVPWGDSVMKRTI